MDLPMQRQQPRERAMIRHGSIQTSVAGTKSPVMQPYTNLLIIGTVQWSNLPEAAP
ncbi:MAG TPA: hypothetical protein VN150_08040 [Ochrobactrum sp.]|nr:hypothetical protein [Ochrobactrum sp.]